jgi:uncharacterized protein YutD
MRTLKPLNLKPQEQYYMVDDLKLRMTLATLADKYSEQVRRHIYITYNDARILTMFNRIRASGLYQKGSKRGARHRKIVEFPNGYVYDFVDTVMRELYGRDWMKNNKALNHELVKPWWVVNKL